MSYATGGSGGDLDDLMGALQSFCAAEGWTIDKYDTVAKLLFMHKGICFVTMWWGDTSTVSVYSGPNNAGVATPVLDGRIYMAIGTANTAGLATYHSHPGSVVTSNFDNDAAMVNGLSGNYIGWHFFSDPTVSDYVHVVVQKGPEIYRHFSFGHLDQKGLTHSGVAYVTGQPSNWYRNVNQFNPSPGNGVYNDPRYQAIPFIRNEGWFSSTGSDNGSPSVILRHVDAWPAAWNGPVAGSQGNGATNQFRHMLGLMQGFGNPTEFPSTVNSGNRLLDMILIAEPMPFSNVVPMFPVPVFRSYLNNLDASKNAICYLGDFPNVRGINMTNMLPGQEINLTGDVWKVFPALRQEQWPSARQNDAPHGGQFAVAYKKVP